MLTGLLLVSAGLLAYANGANDNFKGVASLFGSGSATYRTALSWATLTTFAGSVAALFLAEALLKKFSGRGLVPDALAASPQFVLAVTIGAGATVMLATIFGFPISTTHGLTGALTGAGLMAARDQVSLATLGGAFVLPLALSPLLAVVAGAVFYAAASFARRRAGVTRETCVCAGAEETEALAVSRDGVAITGAAPRLSVAVAASSACAERYTGVVLGVSAARLLDTLHFLSAGAVSFARGLNDTPKIAALLLVTGAVDRRWPMIAVAVAIAIGGLLNARKVAETMSHRIATMNPGQGAAANFSTAALVTTASLHGLPVSTTHVSVGALLGMGIVTGQAKWKPVMGIVASWVVTLPCAAFLAAISYQVIRAGWPV